MGVSKTKEERNEVSVMSHLSLQVLLLLLELLDHSRLGALLRSEASMLAQLLLQHLHSLLVMLQLFALSKPSRNTQNETPHARFFVLIG